MLISLEPHKFKNAVIYLMLHIKNEVRLRTLFLNTSHYYKCFRKMLFTGVETKFV